MTTVLSDSIYAEEIALELEATQRGVERYRRLAQAAIERGQGAALKPAERLMVGWFTALRRGIHNTQQSILNGEPGQDRVLIASQILVCKAEQMAVITMHEALGRCMVESLGTDQRKMSMAIGRAVNAEYNLPRIRADEDAWDELVHSDRRQLKPPAIQRVAAKYFNDGTWGPHTHARLGAMLLKALYDVAYIKGVAAFVVTHRNLPRRKSCYHVRLTEDVLQTIDDGHKRRQFMRPRYAAMIVPPLEWESYNRGGYLQLPTTLVKKASPRVIKRLNESDLSTVCHGVNALGATPWRINKRILGVVKELWDSGGLLAKLPRRDPIQIEPYVGDDASNAKKKDWRIAAAKTHRANANSLSDRTNFAYKLGAAVQYADRERIWFPHSLDFRGRAYPMPVALNHQQDDISRGLLEFANGEELGKRGNYWLGVHLANSCGVDGIPFEQRYQWTVDNAEAICGWAEDPLENTGWMLTDKPFQALAASIAFIDPDSPCHIPIQMDGSCNGLQHYAALGRNIEDARTVNLIDQEMPSDAYRRITAVVAEFIRVEAKLCKPPGLLVDGYIDRKVCKQTVMTSLYGVTQVGARRQVYEQLEAKGLDPEYLYKASQYVSRIVLKCIGDVCPAAARIMEWLTKSARLIAKNDLVSWTTPLAMPVEQHYQTRQTHTIKTVLQLMTLYRRTKTIHPQPGRQATGFAPNFIHSIDASHLLLTASRCANAGMPFAGVHDSYWTTGNHVDQMHQELREAFVELHQHEIIENLAVELDWRFPKAKLQAPPSPGKLDVSVVLKSRYFFQ